MENICIDGRATLLRFCRQERESVELLKNLNRSPHGHSPALSPSQERSVPSSRHTILDTQYRPLRTKPKTVFRDKCFLNKIYKLSIKQLLPFIYGDFYNAVQSSLRSHRHVFWLMTSDYPRQHEDLLLSPCCQVSRFSIF